MKFVTIVEYSNLFFEVKVLQALADIELSIQERCELLDIFYRVNRYGLDREMLGNHFQKDVDAESGTISVVVHCSNQMLELIITQNTASEFFITNCYKRKN
ncbi:hypothetical protein BCJMU51_0858 [Bacillus cereus]|uniref:hypothetical protein n=1 Tax=Bacillus TaxID=1386 RepID=UPI001F370858|nr:MULTISPECIES: hypothetical protein [Bacillus]MCU5718689.1 hypothetical protein [Bacillus cereus]MDA1844928.1 hypothetical protein [Bacillus cereus]WDL93161.1 hypothetical protein JCR32_04940 [Bacillus sp. HNR-4]BCB35991.1 hypothetical protein BCM0045_0886 [Bacillus cereus]BCB98802.1 hypothetical protein BCM0057_0885 [Bacillus cereus]